MAADVLNSPSHIFSLKRSSTPQDKLTNGQFQATQLWHDIIRHLREHVEVKRRRRNMRHYDSCFTGSDAVNVVLLYLQGNQQIHKTVGRGQAVKVCQLLVMMCNVTQVCQLLMEQQVFEAVSGVSTKTLSDRQKGHFEDSAHKLFRFNQCFEQESESAGCRGLDQDCPCGHSLESTESAASSVEGDRPCSPARDRPNLLDCDESVISTDASHLSVMMDITGVPWSSLGRSLKQRSSECLRKLTPARLFQQRRPSDTSIAADESTDVWRQVALTRLLYLVDLPVLDDVLGYDVTDHAPAQRGMTNPAFRRHESLSSTYSERLEDSWLDAAAETLEHSVKGEQLLNRSLSEDSLVTQRLAAYQSVADLYRNRKEPLLPARFTKLHLELLNLLMQVAAHDDSVQLSTKLSNRQEVTKSFTDALLKNKLMSHQQAGQLVMLMADRVTEVFTVPEEVKDAVTLRLAGVTSSQDTCPSETAFCERVTQEQYREQRTDYTAQALEQLISDVMTSDRLSQKEKKTRLKQLQKMHPDIYKRLVPDK